MKKTATLSLAALLAVSGLLAVQAEATQAVASATEATTSAPEATTSATESAPPLKQSQPKSLFLKTVLK